MIVGIVVQFALIANARIIVQHAAHATARSASTSLPDGHPEKVRRAARMALAPISPVAGSGVDPEARDITQAMQDCHIDISSAYAGRYTYAMDATDVSWTNAGTDFPTSPSQEIEVTLRYRFQLTVPVAGALLAPAQSQIAGTSGRFYEITAKASTLTAPGRKTRADRTGLPIQNGGDE